jgi:hypothetical protein
LSDSRKLLLLFLFILMIMLIVSGYAGTQTNAKDKKVVSLKTPPFQAWTATVQMFPTNPEYTGWWGLRKSPVEDRLNPNDKYVSIIFGGLLRKSMNIDFMVIWLNPDGMAFKETAWKGNIPAGLCSFMSGLAIDDYEMRDEIKEITESSFNGEISYKKQKGRLADFPGIWQLEIYMNNKLQTTFQIEF